MKKLIREYTLLVLGSIIFSFAIAAFLVPSKIGVGGVTGIAVCLNEIFHLKIGLTTILVNLPLFIFGYKLIGKNFAFKSALVVFISSVLIDFLSTNFHFIPYQDMLLASIYCGVLFGIGAALIFMNGGSTGGLDILAKMITNRFPNLQLSAVLLVQDIIIYLFVALVFGLRSVMYALIMSFIRTKVIDAIQEGISSSKQCIIISENAEIIIDAIQKTLIRGVTVLDAVGAYSKAEKKLIYVVIQKNQLNALKTMIREIDPEAFVTVSEVSNILGNYRQPVTF